MRSVPNGCNALSERRFPLDKRPINGIVQRTIIRSGVPRRGPTGHGNGFGLSDPTATSCTDHELIAAVRRGDDRAFEELYSRYRGADRVLRVRDGRGPRPRRGHRPGGVHLRAAPPARHRAADRVQALALRDRQERLHRRVSPHSPRPGGPARARRRADASPRQLDRGAPAPDAAVENKQRLDDLRGAFRGLSESHHRIIVMREFEGLSYEQIGDRLGMTKPMVESTLFRARKRLGEEYDELVSGRRCERIQAVIAAGERASAALARAPRPPSARTPPLALPAVPPPRADGGRRRVVLPDPGRDRQDRGAAAVPVASLAPRSLRRPSRPVARRDRTSSRPCSRSRASCGWRIRPGRATGSDVRRRRPQRS